MNLDDYIPHRPPMKLVERLIESEPQRVVAGAGIRPDNPFFDTQRGGVPAWVGLEYMAQTAAIWVGLEDERRGRPVEPAFLISSREYEATESVLAEGEAISIEVRPDLVEDPLVSFSGVLRGGDGRELARGIFTAYRPEDVDAYLQKSEPILESGEQQ